MSGLWRNSDDTPEGKYLVQRRDGSIPDWPYFVIGAKDPCAWHALMAYANAAEERGLDPEYVSDIRQMADQFQEYRYIAGDGDPDAPRHRVDDPETIAKMKQSRSA